jgi:hypothetical protein
MSAERRQPLQVTERRMERVTAVPHRLAALLRKQALRDLA